MSTSFSWLHLTDFHQGADKQYLGKGVNHRFFESLKTLHQKCGPWDLVIFTGDLTNRGSANEFQELNQFLEELWEQFRQLQNPLPKLLAVPGNHDLARPKKKSSELEILTKWANHPDAQEEFWNNEKSSYRKLIDKVFKNYTHWLTEQPFQAEGLRYSRLLPGDFSYTFEKDNAKLGIIGLNTAFLQLNSDNYEGRLVLDAYRQFNVACHDNDGPKWAKQHHAWLIMTHHPREWLTETHREQLNEIINDHDNFAVHLCGHLHEAAYTRIGVAGTKIKNIWQGRSLFGLEYFNGKEQRSHGYTAGKIELDGDKRILTIWPRLDHHYRNAGRKVIPDYLSIYLTDDLHTEPVSF